MGKQRAASPRAPRRPVLLKDKGNAYTDLRRRLEASIRALHDQEAQVLRDLETAWREQQLLLEMLLSADLTLALLEAPPAAPPSAPLPASPPVWRHGGAALAHSPSIGVRTPNLGSGGGGGGCLSGDLLGEHTGQPCCWQLLELDGMDTDLGGHLLLAPPSGSAIDSGASTLDGAFNGCGHEWQPHTAQVQQAAAAASSTSSLWRSSSADGSHHAAAASSYAAQLLQAATHTQLQCVVGMSAADWSKRFSTTFAKLLLLLEVATRVPASAGDSGAGDDNEAPTPAHAAHAAGNAAATTAAVIATGAAARALVHNSYGTACWEPAIAHSGSTSGRSPLWRMHGVASPLGSPCVLGIEHSWEHGGSHSPDSSVAGTAHVLAPTGGAGAGFSTPGVDASSDARQLQHLVDEWLTLTLLARLHNPMSLYQAAAMNHATKQAGAAAPHAHWRQVASRLGITAAQRQHLGVAWHQFLRQRRAATVQAAALAAEVAAGNADRPCAERSSIDAPVVLLQRCVHAFPLHAMQLVLAVSNTLTGVQMAQLLVASYPFMPLLAPVVEAVVSQQEECQHARLRASTQPTTAAAVPGGTPTARGCCCGAWVPTRSCCQADRQLLNDQHITARLALLEQQCSWWQAASGGVFEAAEGAV